MFVIFHRLLPSFSLSLCRFMVFVIISLYFLLRSYEQTSGKTTMAVVGGNLFYQTLRTFLSKKKMLKTVGIIVTTLSSAFTDIGVRISILTVKKLNGSFKNSAYNFFLFSLFDLEGRKANEKSRSPSKRLAKEKRAFAFSIRNVPRNS